MEHLKEIKSSDLIYYRIKKEHNIIHQNERTLTPRIGCFFFFTNEIVTWNKKKNNAKPNDYD